MKYWSVIFSIIFLGCFNDPQNLNSNLFKIKNDYGQNIEINYYLEENLDFKLIAPEISKNRDQKNTFPKGVQVFVFNEKLDTIATIFADSAAQHKDEKIIEIRKNVVLKHNKKTLHTARLFWNRETKKIYNLLEDSVMMIEANDTIRGYRFESDQNFKQINMSTMTGTLNF